MLSAGKSESAGAAKFVDGGLQCFVRERWAAPQLPIEKKETIHANEFLAGNCSSSTTPNILLERARANVGFHLLAAAEF